VLTGWGGGIRQGLPGRLDMGTCVGSPPLLFTVRNCFLSGVFLEGK